MTKIPKQGLVVPKLYFPVSAGTVHPQLPWCTPPVWLSILVHFLFCCCKPTFLVAYKWVSTCAPKHPILLPFCEITWHPPTEDIGIRVHCSLASPLMKFDPVVLHAVLELFPLCQLCAVHLKGMAVCFCRLQPASSCCLLSTHAQHCSDLSSDLWKTGGKK